MSSIAIEIVNKFDSLGLSDVLKEFTKEEIETSAFESKDPDVKKKLLTLAKNWEKAYTVLSTIESLSEIIDNIQPDESEDEFLQEIDVDDEENIVDPFSNRDWEAEDFDGDN
jgi:hypothetical protein